MSSNDILQSQYDEWRQKNKSAPMTVHDDSNNINKYKSCPNCGSLNVSIDLSNGKIDCIDCGLKDKNPNFIDLKDVEKRIDDEKEKIIERIRLGDYFNKGF